ncbi:hypothetical protein EJ08DRAFT_719948 [Tothia fuscella]|uniref:Uncharacterized protein n=1 Tax=Tothia fuscella TaxID=1048955 RepID=A0A9P4NMW0_9PEZI|nr:hypothetical protein EJ08DRAFT_719948 [Tothia fuscella]
MLVKLKVGENVDSFTQQYLDLVALCYNRTSNRPLTTTTTSALSQKRSAPKDSSLALDPLKSQIQSEEAKLQNGSTAPPVISCGKGKAVEVVFLLDVIISNSGFYKRQFEKVAPYNGQPELILMPTVSPKVFEVWTGWVYKKCIYIGEVKKQDMKLEAIFRLLCEAYFLGTKLEDMDFQDAVIDSMIEISKQTKQYPLYNTKFVYENTQRGSCLRQLLVHFAVYRNMDDMRFESVYLYNQEARADIAQAMMVARKERLIGQKKCVNFGGVPPQRTKLSSLQKATPKKIKISMKNAPLSPPSRELQQAAASASKLASKALKKKGSSKSSATKALSVYTLKKIRSPLSSSKSGGVIKKKTKAQVPTEHTFPDVPPFMNNTCFYHIHTQQNKPCYKIKLLATPT